MNRSRTRSVLETNLHLTYLRVWHPNFELMRDMAYYQGNVYLWAKVGKINLMSVRAKMLAIT